MFRILPAVIALGVGSAQAQQAPLQPSQKWVAEYAESMCVLSRIYGTGKDATTLALRYLPLSDRVEVVLFQRNKGSDGSRWGDVAVTLSGIETTVNAPYWSLYHPKLRKRIARADVELSLEAFSKAESISLKYDAEAPVVLALSDVPAALRVMDHCAKDLLKVWGIDPDFKKAIAQEATAAENAPVSWITDRDYPREAIIGDMQGVSSIYWRINTEGRADECRVIRSSGYAILDESACRAITRSARYQPALGHDGKPVASYGSRNVRWVMDDRPPPTETSIKS